MTKTVKFKCPLCGKKWTEEQDTDDEWFGIGTDKTLCDECGEKMLKKLQKERDEKARM